MSVHSLPQIPQDEEAALVDRARQGDRNAVGSLLDPWRKPLFGYIYRMVTLRQDAEDLLQDVLVRVLENIRGYRGEARFKSWVFGIATHVCLDHLRRRRSHPEEQAPVIHTDASDERRSADFFDRQQAAGASQ